MRLVDRFLDGITMYRLLLYYLMVVLVAAMGLGGFGYLPYAPWAIAAAAVYLVVTCWLVNKLFAHVFEAPTNYESSLITALILSLIITPKLSLQNLAFLGMAGLLAMSSKYILAIRKKHLFNPAAMAVTLTALAAGKSASWWVGNSWLTIVVVIGGLLLARKVRRFQMVLIFLSLSLISVTVMAATLHHGSPLHTLRNTALHSSLWFMGFVMLTEPLTSPGQVKQQRWYGALAGLLFPPQLHILNLYSTPELVLVICNTFAYLISPKIKVLPRLVQKLSWGPSTKDFVFATGRKFAYQPGQYMEWTLPHARPDNRGNRRYFSLASSPTEDTLRLGVKFYPQGSSFKHALWSINKDSSIAAGQLGGNFTLPNDRGRKLVFIAGGIGITPFRSMLKYLIDTEDHRTVTLLYSERTPDELAYHDVLKAARQQLGAKIVYTITDKATAVPTGMRTGYIDAQMIAREVPDYTERLFYISGPHSMVTATKTNLKSLGVKDHNIKIDFFPGYA